MAPLPIAIGALLLSSGAAVHQGQLQKQQARRSLRAQKAFQAKAESRAISETRRSEAEQRRLNRRTPDLSAILLGERAAARRGPAATLLTGASGIEPQRLTLAGRGARTLGGR
jgi:hypothetical protein